MLFASDSPWSDAAEEKARLETYSFTAEEKEMIFHANAERVLGIKR